MAVRINNIFAKYLMAGGKSSMDGCKINIYSGSQPSSPADAATGTLLGTVTLAGDGSTGLTWETPTGNTLEKPAAASWAGEWVANGTAGWARIYDPTDASPGTATTTLGRMDMVCTRTGSTECIMSTLTAVTGASFSINSATITLPLT